MYEELAKYARVIVYDRRGIVLSDARASTLDDQIEEIRAVLDAEGIERVVHFGFTVGAPSSFLFAAAEPDRVSHLVISSGFAKATRSDGYPHGTDPATRDVLTRIVTDNWGSGIQLAAGMPSLAGDEDFRKWGASLERHSMSPGAAARFFSLIGEIDVRAVPPSVRQPVLIIQPEASTLIEAGHSAYPARELPNATYVNIPGADLVPVAGEARDLMVSRVQEFLTGQRPVRSPDRAPRTATAGDPGAEGQVLTI